MMIACAHCGEMFKSVLIEPGTAALEIGSSLAQHLARKHHRQSANLLAKVFGIQAMVSGFVLLQDHASIPESESALHEILDKDLNTLLDALGLTHAEEHTSAVTEADQALTLPQPAE